MSPTWTSAPTRIHPRILLRRQEKFGGCNSKFYVHVYELILRLRGNYLWPAMWGRSLFDDDPESQRLADELGIVLSTSHHEPMQRAHVEWARYGQGPWDYSKNAQTLQAFWREGVRRMNGYESVVTVGMRGDGDEPMSESANIELLQRIVRDQRATLAEELGVAPEAQPQVWALYKEVQEYYDRGMSMPDDVTLLLCDDNWGNVRRLPYPNAPRRAGGYGMYYHFDYVGDPRNYKWLNTNQLSRVWEQMHLCWRHGVDRIWIANVGDLKPMEQPIDFFLTMAWDPDQFPAEAIAERLPAWQRHWAAEQFGSAHAADIAELIAGYVRLNARRKPELLDASTYSLKNHREWEQTIDRWRRLADKAQQVEAALPAAYRDAYYQIVLHPVLASANLNELYYAVARNRRYADQERAATNDLADRAERFYERDGELTNRYHALAGGKWNHMMSQTHIGYTGWQQPDEQVMPAVRRIVVPEAAQMGVAIEGDQAATLPVMLPGGPDCWIDVYNRGRSPLSYSVSAEDPWLEATPTTGNVSPQVRLRVTVNWSKFPRDAAGPVKTTVTIKGSDGSSEAITAAAYRPRAAARGFVEANGYIALNADSYDRAVAGSGIGWVVLPDCGRTGAAVISTPVTAGPTMPHQRAPRLDYPIRLVNDAAVRVEAYLSPTLDYLGADASGEDAGVRFAVSLDDEPATVVDMHAERSTPERNFEAWRHRVASNIHVVRSPPIQASAGNHTLRFWRVDPGVVLQKLVVITGQPPDSYLGPPQSPQAPIE
ncbi:MAG: glycosyl hydrolase [Planctomycetota bacterium]|nr:MAG: glycosyl hydrolase [Planctomycetota bacterium]